MFLRLSAAFKSLGLTPANAGIHAAAIVEIEWRPSHLVSSHPRLLSSHRIASHRISSRLLSCRVIASHRIASHRISSRLLSSHRTASHRIASHRISSRLIASHRIASHRIASHRIASHRIASRPSPCICHCTHDHYMYSTVLRIGAVYMWLQLATQADNSWVRMHMQVQHPCQASATCTHATGIDSEVYVLSLVGRYAYAYRHGPLRVSRPA